MRRIRYIEQLVETDARVAGLVLEYATTLAQAGNADQIDVPNLTGSGEVHRMTMVIGPASQVMADDDDGRPFPADVSAEIRDLEHRIALGAPTTIAPDADLPDIDYDDLEGPGTTPSGR